MKNNIDRRRFIKLTSAGAASTLVGASILSAGVAKSANETINLGVIGTGSRGTGLIKTLQDVPEISVMAGCDILPDHLTNALNFAEKGSKGYSDYRKLLDNKDVDAVLISVPLWLHTQVAIDALDAGKHVYCEKTMSYDSQQALRLVQAVKKSKKIFQVGHQYHSSRLYSELVQYLDEGYIGKVMGFECQWNRNGDWRRPVKDPKLEKIINWRMYREFSKGLLAELSSHQIDFANWVTKSHPISVMGTGGIDYWKDGRETYDNIRVIFEYPGGIKAAYTCLTFNSLNDYQIKVFGDEATLIIGYNDAKVYLEKNKKKELGLVDGVSGATLKNIMEGDAIVIKSDHMDPSKQALVDFGTCIKNNKEPISNVVTGAKASFAVSMALEAIDKKQVVTWKDEYNV